MTLLQIINLIKETALAQPNVNTFVRNFLDLNRENTKYSAIVLQDRDGLRDRIQEQDWNTFTFHLGYVDRLTFDESNRDDIFSTGVNIINNIVASLRQRWFPDIEVSVIDRFSTFDQRFTASCAGVYVVLAIQIPVSDCVDSEQTNIYDTYQAKFTENGHYHYVPDGKPVDEIDITVDVEGGGEKPEETLTETIITNGSHHYNPTPGSVFSDVDITVAVPVPTMTTLTETLTSNSTYSYTAPSGQAYESVLVTVSVPSDMKPETICDEIIQENGSHHYTPPTGEVFSNVHITTDIHPSMSLVETITGNGSHSFSGEWTNAVITVDVSSSSKPEETLVQTISTNGSYHYDPTPGYVFGSADISVDVHPSQSLIETIAVNGTRTFTGEWNGAIITTDVHPSQSLVQNISTNGVTSLSGEWTNATITVAVPTTTTVSMSQSAYDNLSVKDPNTIYLING